MTGGRPRRRESLDVNVVDDGYVVYDAARDRVHYLNHTAALVLEWCDGTRTTREIARRLQEAFGLEDAPEDETSQCVTRLREEGLVTDG